MARAYGLWDTGGTCKWTSTCSYPTLTRCDGCVTRVLRAALGGLGWPTQRTFAQGYLAGNYVLAVVLVANGAAVSRTLVMVSPPGNALRELTSGCSRPVTGRSRC